MLKSYQITKLRPLSVRICAILCLKYNPNIANITKWTPKPKPYVVLILLLTVDMWLPVTEHILKYLFLIQQCEVS
jgi:hypothetical protein